MKNTGNSAFPVTEANGANSGWCGMDLRDYFAAQVIPAVLSAYIETNGRCLGSDHIAYNCASHAYRIADAMIQEGKK